MITITRNRRSGTSDHNIYTEQEAKEEGIDYKYWKDCEIGDWGLSDDGYVMECEKKYETSASPQIVFSGGRQFATDSAEFLFERNHEMEIYTMNKPKHWSLHEVRQKRFKRAMKILAASVVVDGEYDWETAAHAYRQDEEIPVATLKRVMKQDASQMALSEELQNIYKQKGFTKSDVIDDLVELRKLAKDKGDLSNLNRAVETSIKLLDMDPKKGPEVVDEFSMDVSRQINGEIQKEQAKLKGKRTHTPEDSEDGDIAKELNEVTEDGDDL